MNKLAIVALSLLLTTGLYGCNSEAEAANTIKLQVSLMPNQHGLGYGPSAYVIVTSLEDQPVEITDILVNRGNSCEMPGKFTRKTNALSTSKKYAFGEAGSAVVRCSISDVREVQVQTDRGVYVFTF